MSFKENLNTSKVLLNIFYKEEIGKMAVQFEELDLLKIFRDIGKICKGEQVCGKCVCKECLVGYSRECIAYCRRKMSTFVPKGKENIPQFDIRGGYDEYEVLFSISHLLGQCCGCKEEHFENCIINIVRNCLEVIEFGEEQEYEGVPLQYLMKMATKNKVKADIMTEEYLRVKQK